MREYRLGRLGGLWLSARPSALAGALGMWLLLGALATRLLGLPRGAAARVAGAAVGAHWLSGIWHHLGHAFAARTTGYPMQGIRLWGILATSVYPTDEPSLPPALHLRRALGGPLASAALAALAALGLRATGDARPATKWLLRWIALDNLLTYTLQLLIPVGFNDGTTLWRWLPRLVAERRGRVG